MIDKNTIQAIEAGVYASGIPQDAEAVLLIEVDGLRFQRASTNNWRKS